MTTAKKYLNRNTLFLFIALAILTSLIFIIVTNIKLMLLAIVAIPLLFIVGFIIFKIGTLLLSMTLTIISVLVLFSIIGWCIHLFG